MILILNALQLSSQIRGYLELKGKAIKNNTALKDAIIKLYRNDALIKEVTTTKSGKFAFDLDFTGEDHKITFEAPGCVNMHLMVYTSQVTDDKKSILPYYETEVVFFEKTSKTIDLTKYQYPFLKIIFDGEKAFKDDEKYFSDFSSNIFIKQSTTDAVTVAKPKTKKILGNLSIEATTEPIKHTRVSLLNEAGEIIQSSITNDKGGFVFTELPADEKFVVIIDDTDYALKINDKIIMKNKKGEQVQVIAKTNERFEFKFLEAEKKETLMILEEDDSVFEANYRGVVTNKDNQPLAFTKINLVNIANNNIIATATSDKNGEFVFKGVEADKNYIFDISKEDNLQLNNSENIFITNEQKNVSKKLVLNEKHFTYALLTEDKKTFSALELEDESTLAMRSHSTSLKGKNNYPPKYQFADNNLDGKISIEELLAITNNPNTNQSTAIELIEWYLN
ncbi:MAG: carboxypeptidase regulatory-like domain-containing protein [Bacteroidetes bacterium]|nr:carboxypeptidase regulatory-like domain-containing protein [Bacteroidota bacterium]